MHLTAKTLTGRDPRSGIALVIVLGFLTVLVLMAVSFAIVMRTERMAARAFADVVRAKQITQAGMARALSEIEADLAGSADFYPSFSTPGYPDTLVSENGSNVLYGMATTLGARRFFPRAVWTTDVGYPRPVYQDIRDPGTNKIIIGRYAYLAVNCSGLLDANYIGGSNRTYGSSPAEVQLDTTILSEITTYATNELPARRNSAWKRFESLPDLLALCKSNATLPQYIISPTMYQPATENTSNLFIYSYAPQGWIDSTGLITNPVYVGGTNLDLAAIQAEFTAMGVSDPAALRDALVDYTDADFVPQNVGNFSTEPTPLINEITIQQQMPTIDQNICRPTVEIWYPFVGVTNPNNYTLILTIIFTNAQPAQYNPRNVGPIGAGRYGVVTTLLGPWSGPRYVSLSAPSLPNAVGTFTNPVTSLNSMKAIVGAELRQGDTAAGTLVDRAAFTVDMGFSQMSVGAPTLPVTGGAAVTDPRLNYNSNEWKRVGQGAGFAPTPGAFNTGIADPASGDGLAATNIFIPNRPLRSVGELGLLMAGTTPWRTVQLLGTNALPVLHRFTMFTNATFKGRVNLNSPHRDVLASVLLGAAAEPWPGSPAAIPVTAASARTVADSIIAVSPFNNVGDMGSRIVSGAFPGYSALDSESILRSSADLFTTRQQVFTIMVQGEYIDPYGNPSAIAKAVAVVWRDPFPNPDGSHRTFTSFFKWLGELE